jgi:hypothetical protein
MPSELIRYLWPSDLVVPNALRFELFRKAIQQINKDLEMSGSRHQLPLRANPMTQLEDLKNWMKTAPSTEVIRFLYRLDVPEVQVTEGPEQLALRCLQRALMKVWLRSRASGL